MRIVGIIRWSIVAGLIVLLAGPALVVALSGIAVVEVDGRSMEPAIRFGDVVVITKPDPSDFVVGAVVTAEDSTGAKYTHRITGIEENGDLLLRGDNNSVGDPAPVPQDAVVGVVSGQFSGPLATFIVQLQGWPLRICLLVMVIGLVFLPLPAGPRKHRRGSSMKHAAQGSRRRATNPVTAAHAATEEQSAATLPEAHRTEALELVDGMRSAMARVLLASERRLVGRITVTTHATGELSFPAMRMVIEVAEKQPAASGEQEASSVPIDRSQERAASRTRRSTALSSTESRVVALASAGRTPDHRSDGSLASGASAVLGEEQLPLPPLSNRVDGPPSEPLPTRRSNREATRHGRRRAG